MVARREIYKLAELASPVSPRLQTMETRVALKLFLQTASNLANGRKASLLYDGRERDGQQIASLVISPPYDCIVQAAGAGEEIKEAFELMVDTEARKQLGDLSLVSVVDQVKR